MIGLLIAVVLFNLIAFLRNNRLTKNQSVPIGMFTVAFQVIVDSYLSKKFHAYWHFSEHLA